MTYLAKPKFHHPALPKNSLGFTHRDYEGSISTLEKDFGAALATLSFSPSIFAREKPPSEITIDDVSFGGATLGELPAIVFSEAMFDLSVFAAK